MSAAPVQVPPSPMSLGDVFTATFSVFRRRLGAFLALTGLQQLVSLVLLAVPIVISVVVLVPYVARTVSTNQMPSTSEVGVGLLVIVAGFFVAAVVSGIVSLVFDGMMITCANEAVQGRFPTLSEIRTLSKGYVGRIVGLYFLAMLAYLVAITVVCLPVLLSLGSLVTIAESSSGTAQTDAGLAFLAAMFLTFALLLALMAGVFLLSVKVAYVAQVCAVERLSGFAALRRAWGITKGAFWRTFGYLLVFSLAAGAIQQGISYVIQFVIPTMSSVNSSSSSSSSARAVLSMLGNGTLAMVFAAVYGVAVVIALVMVPLRHTFVTVMYADQLRRQQLGPVNHAFAMNVPGYGQQPYVYAQGHGFPQPGPQPGYGAAPGPGTYAPPPQQGYGQQPPYAGQG